ncbi:MAG: hypothetical protein Ct9H300mP16_17190 [Pseudomonadota bacterium]|nr:MAG: hypothetical protein Ct9H300mP16_17190 [Pseudomonadota bacterium]
MESIATWEKLLLGVVALLALMWFLPGVRQMTRQSRETEADGPRLSLSPLWRSSFLFSSWSASSDGSLLNMYPVNPFFLPAPRSHATIPSHQCLNPLPSNAFICGTTGRQIFWFHLSDLTSISPLTRPGSGPRCPFSPGNFPPTHSHYALTVKTWSCWRCVSTESPCRKTATR